MSRQEQTTSIDKSHDLTTTIKQAFELKKNPLPWVKAICAGLCAASPIFIAVLVGHFQYGLLASIGSFTFLYMFNEPYALRAKKLFFVMIGLSSIVGIGTLLAPYPFALAIGVASTGAIMTFIFGVLRFPGPAAVFFVLAFAITTSMEINPSQWYVRSGFALLGGLLSWIVAMLGWFIDPRRPETLALKRLYIQLAFLFDSVGTEEFSKARHATMMQIKEAGSIIHAGYISWDKSILYKKLYLLYEQANIIYVTILKNYTMRKEKLSPELGEMIRTFASHIDKKDLLEPEKFNLDVNEEVATRIEEVKHLISGTSTKLIEKIPIGSPSIKKIFKGAFHRNSVIFRSSIRYGVILLIATLIAFSFGFERAYWIPLSCAAVMLGSTVISTFHRSIQRAVGTTVGVLIASVLLSFQPDGFLIAIYILVLTFLTELLIPKNYALAVIFLTSTAIFMTEHATQIFDVRYFAAIRLADIVLGCAIGLIGTYIIGRRSASSRLPHIVAKTIRSQIQFIVLLFSEQPKGFSFEESSEMRKMQTNLNNLQIMYTTALGEIPNNKESLGFLWPVIFSIEQLGNLLVSATKISNRVRLSDEDLAQMLLIFEMMAKAAEFKQTISIKKVPEINGFPHIQKEIIDLQDALKISKESL